MIEILNISGDVGILVRGSNLVSVLQETCIGMYDLITDLQNINPNQSTDVYIEEDSLESLVVCLLNELIFQFEANDFIGRLVEIDLINIDGLFKIHAIIKGEPFDSQRHPKKLLIKAATYHNLLVLVDKDECVIRVVFDI